MYIEAYEAAGGAVYDSREMDFGTHKLKEAREISIDIETTGAVTATLYADGAVVGRHIGTQHHANLQAFHEHLGRLGTIGRLRNFFFEDRC